MLEWIKEQIQKAEPELPKISIGSEWILCFNGDPWGPKKSTPVKILDVKDGWVRYDMGGFFRDERKKIEDFVRVYRLVTPA